MKYQYLSLLFFALAVTSCSKDNLSPGQADAFIKFFGGSGTDEAFDVKLAGDGGYFIAGSSTVSTANTDILLINTDRYGNELWSATFGGPGNDACNSMQITPDGGVILLCTYSDTLLHQTDLYLVKTSPATQGAVQWEKRITRNGNQSGSCIQVLEDGYVMTGSTDEGGKKDILVVRTTTQGEILDNATSWYKYDGYGNSNSGSYIIRNPSLGGFVVVGTTSLQDPGTGLLGNNIVVCRVPGNGNNWANSIFGGQGADEGTCVNHLGANDYMITGTLDKLQSPRMFALKVSIDLINIDQVWSQPVIYSHASAPTTGSALRVLPDGSVIMLGSYQASAGNNDIFLVKADNTGAPVFTKRFGGTGNEFGRTLEQVPGNGFILVGTTGIPEDNNRMIALVKVNDHGEL